MYEEQTIPWWKNAIGYQIYPKSFQDTNHDGIGDLNGIRQRLPYLKELGIDFVWLNPIYASPNVDNGYDISDYQAINPEYGTMAEMVDLIKEAHAHGIKIIMDLVINHTSDQHPWFQEALKGPDNPYHDYYIWADGTQKPNEWESIFGGSIWQEVPSLKKQYLHVFAKEQPDLNWENKQMRQDLYKMIRWWLDLGIDGFRIDAISHIKKSSWDTKPQADWAFSPFTNVAGIDVYLTELGQIFKEYDIVTVGEASGVTAEQAPEWVGENGYFNMIFEFEHISLWKREKQDTIDVIALKKALSHWQKQLDYGKGWNALYMENHDVPRSVSVFGNDQPVYRQKAATALATMYLLLQGTPFIYQGQELGMTNMTFTDLDQLDDVTAKQQIEELRKLEDSGERNLEILELMSSISRDNSRTPMQWSTEENAGFSTAEPWLVVNPNYEEINVATQLKQPNSILSYYKQLIQLRKNRAVFVTGHYHDYLLDDPKVYVYERFLGTERMLVVVNLTKDAAEIDLPAAISGQSWTLVIDNHSVEGANSEHELQLTQHQKTMALAPYEARVYHMNQRVKETFNEKIR